MGYQKAPIAPFEDQSPMPTYDYQCGKCGIEFEREQRITEPPVKTCPKCKSRQVKRLLSAPGFILKGGGWYADGYGSGAKKSKSSSGDEKASSTSSSSDSSTGASSGSGSSSSSDSSSSGGDSKPSSGGSSDGGKSSSGKSSKSAA
jgi:putative FmdB family regulatory protein